jgi:serine/threonine protein phosphatase PrpC
MLRVAEEFHATHTGQQRRANEDAMFARAPLFAVADGMGGAQAGEIASRIAVETLGAGVQDPDAAHTVEERLADLIREANDRIHELSRSDDRRAGMGTTMTAALVGADEVTLAHVGDSRAYLLRERQLSRLTRDHSLVEELVQQGKLTPEEASTHPQRSVITRAVGPEARVEVDTHTSGARAGDVFLICSDGLTTMVDEQRIEQLITGAASLQQAGHALIDAANAAGGRDNITVVLFRLEDVAPSAAANEQATGVHRAVSPPAEQREAAAAGSVSTLERKREARPPKPLTRRLQPIAPPDEEDERPRRGGRVRRLFVVLAVVALIAVPVGFGGLIALRSVYFVGTGDDGFVTVFRGLPYELPFGVALYQENYVSPIARDQVPAGRRTAVTDQKLRSQDDAYDLVRQLELGQLRGTQ